MPKGFGRRTNQVRKHTQKNAADEEEFHLSMQYDRPYKKILQNPLHIMGVTIIGICVTKIRSIST